MPEWIDDNTVKGEITAEDYAAEVHRQMVERLAREESELKPGNYGNDGIMVFYQETRQTRSGYRYCIAICGYWWIRRTIGDGYMIIPEGSEPGDDRKRWVVLEGTSRMPRDVAEFVDMEEVFCRDSAHYYSEGKTIRQQWQDMEEAAVRDEIRLSAMDDELSARVRALRRAARLWRLGWPRRLT